MTEIIRPPKQRASKKSLAFFAVMLGLVVLLLIYRYSLIIALASSVLTVIVAATVLICRYPLYASFNLFLAFNPPQSGNFRIFCNDR